MEYWWSPVVLHTHIIQNLCDQNYNIKHYSMAGTVCTKTTPSCTTRSSWTLDYKILLRPFDWTHSSLAKIWLWSVLNTDMRNNKCFINSRNCIFFWWWLQRTVLNRGKFNLLILGMHGPNICQFEHSFHLEMLQKTHGYGNYFHHVTC